MIRLILQKTPYTVNDELYKNNRLSFAVHYNTKFGTRVTGKPVCLPAASAMNSPKVFMTMGLLLTGTM